MGSGITSARLVSPASTTTASSGAGQATVIRWNTVGNSAARTPLLLNEGSLESRVTAAYQSFYNDAWKQTVSLFNQGEITVPAGMPWRTALGRETDSIARGQLRLFLRDEGLGDDVLVNRWLRDPTGSGRYRIPDVRLPSQSVILEGTIGNKSMLTSQIQDFINFSGGSRVVLVRPTVSPGFAP